jgi:hypothetical protein
MILNHTHILEYERRRLTGRRGETLGIWYGPGEIDLGRRAHYD